MSAVDLLLATITMAVGASVQGAVGFGVNLLAAPLLVLVDPLLVPGPVTVTAMILNILVIRRENADHDPGIRLAAAGLVPGTVLAGVVLAALPQRGLTLSIGVLVLVAVALTASGVELRPTPPTLLGAGAVSGFMGTISGIGAPPVALVYQRAKGPVLRATLARYFLIGGGLSLAVLAAVGRLGLRELGYAAALTPGTVAGFAISGALARHLDKRTARPAVLALSALAGVAVVVTELL